MNDLRNTPLGQLLFLSALMGGASLVEDTATGNPVVFSTEVAKPLVSLKANFLPIQSGTGDPSPTNIRPITGWTGLDVLHGGKNLYDKTKGKEGFVWWQGSELVGYNEFKSSDKIPVVPNSKYTLSKDATGQNQLQYFDASGNYIDQSLNSLGNTVSTITIPDNVYFVAFNIKITALDSVQFEAGQTATSYEPYTAPTSYPVTWTTHGTIYGGYVDLVTGEVWGTWTRRKISELIDNYQANWGGRFRGNVADMTKSGNDVVKTGLACEVYNPSVQTSNDLIICRYMNNLYIKDTQYGNDVDAFKTAMGNYYVAYLLDTPVLIATLSPQQINALKGNNTVWSDANGDCSVTFLKKG